MIEGTMKISRACKRGNRQLASGGANEASAKGLEAPALGSTDQLFENFITKKELAQKLSVSKGLINRLMAEEGLPHVKIGRAVRFRLSDVLAWFVRKGK